MTSTTTEINPASALPTAEIFTGTAGYNYSEWRNNVFYPKGLKHADEFRHYSGVLSACEINATFHGVPREETFANWYKNTKQGFVFALKIPTEITHEKRLDGIEEVFEFFITRAQSKLKEKLGPVLFQLPPSLDKDIPKLKETCALATKHMCQFAFEFRSPTWYCDEVYTILREHNAAICENFSPDGHTVQTKTITADWCYTRFHKNKQHGETNYSETALSAAASHITDRCRQGLKQYLFFLNDVGGHGPKNAKQIVGILSKSVANATPLNWKPDKVIEKGGLGSIGGMFAKMKSKPTDASKQTKKRSQEAAFLQVPSSTSSTSTSTSTSTSPAPFTSTSTSTMTTSGLSTTSSNPKPTSSLPSSSSSSSSPRPPSKRPKIDQKKKSPSRGALDSFFKPKPKNKT